jgi:hypothetical protein
MDRAQVFQNLLQTSGISKFEWNMEPSFFYIWIIIKLKIM